MLSLTQYLDGVDLIAIVAFANLAYVVTRVLRHHVVDLQVVSVHQAEARVPGHHEIGGRQYSAAPAPKQYIRPCIDSKSQHTAVDAAYSSERSRLVQKC